MQVKQNLSTSTFKLEKHQTQSNVTYLQVRAMVISVSIFYVFLCLHVQWNVSD